jgi:tetratricopeptide (TPR) repeat protein
MTSLAALFYFAALLLFVLWRLGDLRGRWAWSGIVLAFAAGMGTKSHVVTLPAALLLLDVAFFAGWRRYHALALGGMAVAAIPVGLIAAGGAFAHFLDAPPHRDFSGYERWLTQGRVIWHYLSLLVWPDAGRLQVDYDFTISRALFDPAVTALAWTGLVALTIAAIWSLRGQPWLAGGWLFFMLALSVESSFILLEIAFEHRLYLPAALLIPGAIAPIFVRLQGQRATSFGGVAVLLVGAVFAWQTMERNQTWNDPGTLWRQDLDRGASEQRAALNSAIGHLRSGNSAAAVKILERNGIDTQGPDALKVVQARGEALFAQGRFEDAMAQFRRVLKRAPYATRTAHFAARSLWQLDRTADARDLLAQMQRRNPESLFTVTLAADFAAYDGEPDRALRMLQAYLADSDGMTAVDQSFVHVQRGNILRRSGRVDAAAEAYERATQLHPNNWSAWASLHHALRATGDDDRARQVAQYMRTRGIDPARWR